MNKAIIVTAALLVASPAFAQSGTGSGATKYAPGQQMHEKNKPAPGASEYAPGRQPNTAKGPGHSESAPGQRAHTGSTTTTGSSSGKKKY